MKAFETLCFFFVSVIFLFSHKVRPTPTTCPADSCEPSSSVWVRFPFRLRTRQAPICGYYDPARPGRFSLSCDNRNQTLINLPRPDSSADNLFTVEGIDYADQLLYVNDPENCLPKRLLNRDLSVAAHAAGFRLDDAVSFTFMACRPEIAAAQPGLQQVPCLGPRGGDRVVVAGPTAFVNRLMFPRSPGNNSPAAAPAAEEECSVIGVAQMPVRAEFAETESGPGRDLLGGVRLRWRLPICGECAREGWYCGYQNGPGSSLGCSDPLKSYGHRGISRGAKYGIILAVVIPGILCIIGLISYSFGRLRRAYGQRSQQYVGPSRASGTGVVLKGLDGTMIESFPKIELGESKRLPKPNDNTCPICLAEYQPKETLRTIPKCDHYFHAHCVDEWLKMNATCPICRNSPDCSSHLYKINTLGD